MKNTIVIYSTLALLSAAFIPDAAAQDTSYLDFLRWQQEPVSIVTEKSSTGGHVQSRPNSGSPLTGTVSRSLPSRPRPSCPCS